MHVHPASRLALLFRQKETGLKTNDAPNARHIRGGAQHAAPPGKARILSDVNQGGTTCTTQNDAVILGGGGTSFASPAMAGIQALINQRYGNKQGDTNFVYYALAAQQFAQQGASRCNAS
jgi:hypothetical protein